VKTRTAVSGFTLLETVVALAILALTMTVVYQSLGWSVRRGGEQRQRDLAWLTAQSLLDQMRSEDALKAGRQQGHTSTGVVWESTIEAYQSSPATAGALFGPSLVKALQPLQVTLIVKWGRSEGQTLTLRSVELGKSN
jgi:prepilin-type N-terminal cleavage/methylation domain-containing protein